MKIDGVFLCVLLIRFLWIIIIDKLFGLIFFCVLVYIMLCFVIFNGCDNKVEDILEISGILFDFGS